MAYQRFTFVITHMARPDDPARIALGGQQTLEELHRAIQTAFHFDFDHLYSFFMSGRAWDSSSEYAAVPRPGSGEKSAQHTRLDRLGLKVGASFLYLFDYGDEHHFEVRLEDIATSDRAISRAQFEQTPVNPPAQYESFDEDEDDEDDEDESVAIVSPLEQPGSLGILPPLVDEKPEYDWGGDGSDPHEPVRAHVEAALVQTDGNYPPPLDQLLRLGDMTWGNPPTARIAALGLTQEHVPDLVRMARDRAFNTAPNDSTEVWAPAYAMEALSHLDISAVVPDLIPLFDVDDDWFAEELPRLLGHAGIPALEPLRQYLADPTRWLRGRSGAARALTALVEHSPEMRDQVVQILSDVLAHATENDESLNGFVLAELLSLSAVEALPVIREAFEHNVVDETIAGDWSEVLKELGQVADPADPLIRLSRERWDARRATMWPFAIPDLLLPHLPLSKPVAPSSAPSPKQKKQKNKRKMAQASKKANRSNKKKHK